MFEFTDGLQEHLQAYLEQNFNPRPWTPIRNIIRYAAAQGFGYEETVDLLEYLLDGLGVARGEIEACLSGN